MKIHSSENGKGLEDRIQELEYRIASAEVAVQRYRPEAEGAKDSAQVSTLGLVFGHFSPIAAQRLNRLAQVL
jgi:hypothetical protein